MFGIKRTRPKMFVLCTYATVFAVMCIANGLSLSILAEELRLRGHNKPVTGINFIGDSHQLLSIGEDGVARIWNVDSTNESIALHKGKIGLRCLAVGRSDYAFAGSDAGEVLVWNVKQQRLLRSFEAHAIVTRNSTAQGDALSRSKSVFPVLTICASTDGNTLVTGSSDRTVGVWSIEGKEIYRLKGHSDSVNAVTFSSDDKTLVSGSTDRTIRIWDLSSGENREIFRRRASNEWDAGISAICVLPKENAFLTSGRMAEFFGDYTVRRWDIDNGTEVELLRLPDSAASCLLINERYLAAGTFGGCVHLWSRGRDGVLGKAQSWNFKTTSAVTSIAFSRDYGYLAVGGIDNDIMLLKLKTDAK